MGQASWPVGGGASLPSSFLLYLLFSALRWAASSEPRVQFVNVAREAGITFKHENGASKEKLMPETFGSGVALIDFDNDGLPDLFFANGADLARGKPSPGNVLYHNLGNGKFEDVTEKAGVSGNGMFATGATAGDYDNDGLLDLFVTGYNSRQLFHNNGDGTFTDVTAKAGVAGSGWSSSAAWVDYDRDGYLDLYVVRYLDYDIKIAPYCGYKQEGYRMYCDPQQFDGMPDQLFHNNHDGTFTDVSVKAGIANRAGKGLGVVIGDIDLDGWPDIFVTNDGVRNFLYRNKGDGTFQDITYTSNIGFDMNGKAMAGMGTEIADFDGDGLPDIFLTAFSREYNTAVPQPRQAAIRRRHAQSRIAVGLSDPGVRHQTLRLRQRRRPGHLLHQRPRHRQRGTLRPATQLPADRPALREHWRRQVQGRVRRKRSGVPRRSTWAAAPRSPISTTTATSTSSSPTAAAPPCSIATTAATAITGWPSKRGAARAIVSASVRRCASPPAV